MLLSHSPVRVEQGIRYEEGNTPSAQYPERGDAPSCVHCSVVLQLQLQMVRGAALRLREGN